MKATPQKSAELAARIEERRETLRLSGVLTPEQIQEQMRSEALLIRRDLEIAEQGARRQARTVASRGGTTKAQKQRASMAERIAAERAKLIEKGAAPHTFAAKIARTVKRSPSTVRKYLAELSQ